MLLAEQGEDAIRLRELTAAAQANVAAVHYHFGSLRALFQVAETEAVERIVASGPVLPAAGRGVQRPGAELPVVVGDVDGRCRGNDLVDAVEHVAG